MRKLQLHLDFLSDPAPSRGGVQEQRETAKKQPENWLFRAPGMVSGRGFLRGSEIAMGDNFGA
jgi:hypothetical protein